MISLDRIIYIHELSVIESSYLPCPAGIETSLDRTVRSLVGPRLTWGAFLSIPLRFLSLGHRVLVSIYHHCIHPEAFHSVVTRLDTYFIYAVGDGKPIDLGFIFFDEIVQCLRRFRFGEGQSLRLVLCSLIFRIAKDQCVLLLLDERVVRCKEGAYNLSSLCKSVANLVIYQRADRDESDAFIQYQRSMSEKKGKNMMKAAVGVAGKPLLLESPKLPF